MFDDVHGKMLKAIGKGLFGYAYALTRDKDRAADLYQDCLVRAISRDKIPGDERAFRAWLFTILRNLWIDQLRSLRRQKSGEDELEAESDTLPSPSFEDVVVNQLAVRQAFLQLSQDHRDVLALVDIGGFSYEETASMLDVNRGTIMSRVSRARAQLARILSDAQVVSFPVTKRGRRDG